MCIFVCDMCMCVYMCVSVRVCMREGLRRRPGLGSVAMSDASCSDTPTSESAPLPAS